MITVPSYSQLKEISEAYKSIVNEALYDEQKTSVYNILDEFKDDSARGITKKQWNLIPKKQYSYALKKFMETGPELFMFSERIINDWLDIIIENTQTIDVIGNLTGRNELNGLADIEYEAVMEIFPEEFDKSYEEISKEKDMPKDRILPNCAYDVLEKLGFYEWAVLPDGNYADSDNGIAGVEEILDDVDFSSSISEKLVAINKCLDVFHRRSDWSSAFIEGGKETLYAISNGFNIMDESVNDVPNSVSIDANILTSVEKPKIKAHPIPTARQNNTYLVAARPSYQEREKHQIMSKEEYDRRKWQAARSQDPASRIGNGVYQGLELMAPGMALGRVTKAAKGAKAVSSGLRAKDLVTRGLTAYGSQSLGNEVGTMFDENGREDLGKYARQIGNIGAGVALLKKSPAPTSTLGKIAFGVPGGFGISQAASDISTKMKENGYDERTADAISDAGDWIGFGGVGKPFVDHVVAPVAQKGVEKAIELLPPKGDEVENSEIQNEETPDSIDDYDIN